MPVWTASELNTLFRAVYAKSRDVKDVEELYQQWGGCVRWVLDKPKAESERLLLDAVNATTADSLLAAAKGYNDDSVSSSSCPHLLQPPEQCISWGREALCFTISEVDFRDK